MRRTLLTLALCCSFSQASLAQEAQEHAPLLNAFGRFWGIGYSAGYHAQTNSRLGFHHYSPDHNVVPQPPRGVYGNPNMTTNAAGHPSMYASPMNAPGLVPAMAPVIGPVIGPGQANVQAQPIVPAPPKPVDPPPNWLKQYIKPGDKPRADELLNESLPSEQSPSESSPSDRKGVMLVPSPNDSTTSISITPAQTPVQIGGRPVISVLQQ